MPDELQDDESGFVQGVRADALEVVSFGVPPAALLEAGDEVEGGDSRVCIGTVVVEVAGRCDAPTPIVEVEGAYG